MRKFNGHNDMTCICHFRTFYERNARRKGFHLFVPQTNHNLNLRFSVKLFQAEQQPIKYTYILFAPRTVDLFRELSV